MQKILLVYCIDSIIGINDKKQGTTPCFFSCVNKDAISLNGIRMYIKERVWVLYIVFQEAYVYMLLFYNIL